MTIFSKIALFTILIASILLRLTSLNSLPQAFFTDEAALGYNGWSLATTLRDEYGSFLPLVLRSFDDYKPAVYSYLTIPFVSLFGLSQASSRMPAAVSGVLLILFLFLLVNKITKNQKLGLLAALVLALTPWHIEVSRTAIEAGVSVFFTVLSLFLYERNSNKRNLLSLFFLILALGTYHSARIVAPVLWLAAIFFKAIQTDNKFKIALIVIFIIGVFLSFTSSQSRFKQISIFSDGGAKLLREEAIREDGGAIKVSLLETRIVHNKLISAIQSFSESYLTNISLEYLFLGGAQPPRVTIPETGQFLLIFLPFFVIGLALSIKDIHKPFNQWLVFWFLFAPIPAALTTAEIPHTYRTIFLLPVISIYIAMGILGVYQYLKSKFPNLSNVIIVAVIATTFLNFFKAWHQYRVHQQVHQPWHRQYGYRELYSFLNTIEDVETITITNRENEPYMMYLFHNKIHPKIYQSQPSKRLGHKEISEGAKNWSLFNLTFSEDACPHDLEDKDSSNYYVVLATCELPNNFVRIKTINFLDGNPEFHVDRPDVTIQE